MHFTQVPTEGGGVLGHPSAVIIRGKPSFDLYQHQNQGPLPAALPSEGDAVIQSNSNIGGTFGEVCAEQSMMQPKLSGLEVTSLQKRSSKWPIAPDGNQGTTLQILAC